MSTSKSFADGSAYEVFKAFTKLGFTSFGGPVAHLGYFRDEFVERRRWMSDEEYSDMVALCQFLPGPSSSQVGMAIGQMRAGTVGMLAAWFGFTMPSAIALIFFAWGLETFANAETLGIIHGLKIAAVAVVAHAVVGMARTLTPDFPRVALAVVAAWFVFFTSGPAGQVIALIITGILGRIFLQANEVSPRRSVPYAPPAKASVACLCVLGGLLIVGPFLASTFPDTILPVLDGVFRTGALVFGGGHVVLPFLESTFVGSGRISHETFLAGYGAAQAIPGPLFAFSAFLGAALANDETRWFLGLVILVAMFAPAFLTLVGVLPFWDGIKSRGDVRKALNGVNAGVVGILAAALYDPVWKSAIFSWPDFVLAAAAFSLLVATKLPPIVVVLFCAVGGWILV